MFRKFFVFFLVLLFAFPSFSQKKVGSKKTSQTKSQPSTTTKTPEAKKAVDELKKNPSPAKKKEAVIVFNEDFEKGEELFLLNKPEEAIVYFEKALTSENVDPNVYVYLGVCYYQIENYDKSIAVCVQGLSKDTTDHKVLAYNAGNSCYAIGNYMRADASYAIALKEDANYAPAVLNRANAQLKLDHLEDSKNNYIKYLEIEPETPQRERIETIIRLLEEEIALRAKQKPELINPDSFVSNEKMEVPVIPEKVEDAYIVEHKKSEEVVESEVVVDEAVAPSLPKEKEKAKKAAPSQPEKNSLPPEVLAEEKDAPALPKEVRSEKDSGEIVREKAPELHDKKSNEKLGPGEKVKNPEGEIPKEKKEGPSFEVKPESDGGENTEAENTGSEADFSAAETSESQS